MRAILKTADGLEILTDIPKFSLEVKRPILQAFYKDGEKHGSTVVAVRLYDYVGNRLDDTPIYEEHWY